MFSHRKIISVASQSLRFLSYYRYTKFRELMDPLSNLILNFCFKQLHRYVAFKISEESWKVT